MSSRKREIARDHVRKKRKERVFSSHHNVFNNRYEGKCTLACKEGDVNIIGKQTFFVSFFLSLSHIHSFLPLSLFCVSMCQCRMNVSVCKGVRKREREKERERKGRKRRESVKFKREPERGRERERGKKRGGKWMGKVMIHHHCAY